MCIPWFKKYFIAEKHQPSSEPWVSCNPLATVTSKITDHITITNIVTILKVWNIAIIT